MNVAIIPARGGSKRIPRKNIKPFAGKPMIAHSIFAARESGIFERVIVSTDDEEIARVSRDHGAEVPFMRPAELADDFAGTDAVLLHALTWLEERGEFPPPSAASTPPLPLSKATTCGRGWRRFAGRRPRPPFR